MSGPFGSAIKSENYDSSSPYRYIRAKDIKTLFINDSDPVFIDKKIFDKYPQFHLKEKDILLTVVGMNFGKAAILHKENMPAVFSCKSTLIREASLNPWYLLAYLSCSLGYGLIRRGQRGAAQPGINLIDVSSVLVPIFSEEFQHKIEFLIKSSRLSFNLSKDSYQNAENFLLDELRMEGFSFNEKNTNIIHLKSSFSVTGRLDAEYYQPKYEEMVNRISAQPHARLTDLVTIQKSIEPGSDAYTDDDGLPFLRVADYDKLGISTPQKRLNSIFSNEHFEKLEALKPKKGTILFSKDGSVGEAFCLREDADFITSGAILHLSIRNKQKILPEYLTLALNSILVRTQAERDAGGSIILHWRVDEIKNVLIPLVDITTQQKISSLVQKSFSFKSESERLLEVAKRAVEIAIEQDEAAGLAYIQEHTKGYAL